MRLLIVLKGFQPNTSPDTIGDFKWNQQHGCYAWQGRELKPEEFNQVIDDVLARNKDLWAHPVTVKVIHHNANLVKARAALAKKRSAKPTPELQVA